MRVAMCMLFGARRNVQMEIYHSFNCSSNPHSFADMCPLQATAGFLQAAGVRFNSFFSRDQSTVAAELVKKFHADLGKGFSLSPSLVHPPPSFEMERCLYYTLVHAGDAPDLTRCAPAPCHRLCHRLCHCLSLSNRRLSINSNRGRALLQDLLGGAPRCFSVGAWV